MTKSNIVLALDVGSKRVGVARANMVVMLASPLMTLSNSDDIFEQIKRLAEQELADAIIIGLPRDMQGNETSQTSYVRDFAHKIESHVSLPIYFQDEAVTSVVAEEELKKRGKPYKKEDIDALAAVYILNDFLADHKEV